jgi:hypothetical protein
MTGGLIGAVQEGKMNEEPRGTGDTITEELTRLGRQLVDAGRLAWESEDRRRMQTELSDGLRTLGDSIETTLRQARQNDTTKQIGEQAQKMAAKVQDSGVVDEVRDGLVTGLAGLNRELSRLIDRLATKNAGVAGTQPPDVPAATPPTSPTDVSPASPMGPGDPVI